MGKEKVNLHVSKVKSSPTSKLNAFLLHFNDGYIMWPKAPDQVRKSYCVCLWIFCGR